jgi:hypothetical protein
MRTRLRIPLLCTLLWLGTTATGWTFYNPTTGRWLSRDPIGERGGNSLYAFVGNSPVKSADVLGLESWPGWPGGPWGPGVGSCPCKCLSVGVSYEPGGDTLLLGGYNRWFDHRFGNQVHVRWNVSGKPWKCRYFQDEKGTRVTFQRISPVGSPTTVEGVDGNRVSQVYTDFMGASFGVYSGPLEGFDGDWKMTAHWSVTFRCESEPGSGGETVTRHDTFDVESAFRVPWW